MKTICLLLLAALAFGAVLTVQRALPQTIGFGPPSGSTAYTLTNNGASSVVAAFSFVAPASPFGGTPRLKDFRFFSGSASGSPKVTAMLYTDANGIPGTLIETGAESGVITNGTWNTLSGFTAASKLTAGTQYWIVLRCTAGTSQVISFNYLSSGTYAHPPTSSSTSTGQAWGNGSVSSTDNGTTWTTSWRYGVNGFRIGITDGSDDAYLGLPLAVFTAGTGATEKLYTNSGTAQEFGSYFTTPANTTLKIRGAIMFLKRVGSPTGNVRFRLYSGGYASPTLLGTTAEIPGANITTSVGGYYTSYFPSSISVAGSTILSVTAGNTAADDASNYFLTNKFPVDNDVSSPSLLPFGGIQAIKYSAGTWSVANCEAIPFWLILDSDGEFAATGSGGGGGGQKGAIWQQ